MFLALLPVFSAGCAPDVSVSEVPVDADHDGYDEEVDCDDGRDDVNPTAPELCDGRDNDCDLAVDEDGDETFYADADGDGYGDPSSPTTGCEAPTGHVADATDCDDAAATVHPGADEPDCADPIDYDCDGSVVYADADRDGHAACAECDDADPAVFPGAAELCDGLDNDCDGTVDAGASDPSTWYADSDADGHGDAAVSIAACDAPAGFVADATDCDDADPGVVDCVPLSCLDALLSGVTADGLYTIDPDGPGGAAAYEAWCDMTTDGGGWTLVLDRTHGDACCVWPCGSEPGVVTTLSAATIQPSTTNTGMDATRFAALLAISTDALGLGAETYATCQDTPVEVVAPLSALQAGNCASMGTDLSAVPLSWSEPDCSYEDTDYSLWFGSNALTWMTGICDYDGAWGSGVDCAHPGTIEMYVR